MPSPSLRALSRSVRRARIFSVDVERVIGCLRPCAFTLGLFGGPLGTVNVEFGSTGVTGMGACVERRVGRKVGGDSVEENVGESLKEGDGEIGSSTADGASAKVKGIAMYLSLSRSLFLSLRR